MALFSRSSICPQNPCRLHQQSLALTRIGHNSALTLKTLSNNPFGGLKVADKDIRMLVEATQDYVRWAKSIEGHGRSAHTIRYTHILNDFLLFAISKDIAWKDMFTLDTLQAFRNYSGFKSASRALIVLSGYLFSHGRIDQPIEIPRPKIHLPDIYEHYLVYHEQSLQVSRDHLRQARAMLASFHSYLESHNIRLSNLKIEHLDEFIAGFKVAHSSLKTYRSYLRGFLNSISTMSKGFSKETLLRCSWVPLYLLRASHPSSCGPRK